MFKFNFFARHTGWRAPAALIAAAMVAVACGGGGGESAISGSPEPLSFSSGRISGFGSIIVNGVHFDESTAKVTDDDDNLRSRTELGLGMIVEVNAGQIVRGAERSSSTASEIVVRSEIKGPVEAVDAAAGTLTVLGQRVVVDASTVFENLSGGLAALKPGQQVEVFAFLDVKTGIYSATRIELEAALAEFKLRGVVAALDAKAKTFRIGAALISFAQVPADQMPSLADGQLVRVKLLTTQQAGAWVATKLKSGVRRIEGHAEAEAEGVVSDFVSLGNFKVNGVSVDASGTNVVFENGSQADIANGVRLEAEGAVTGNVLIARKIEFKRAEKQDDIEVHGSVQAVDPAAKTLTVRDMKFSFSAATVFRGGTAADLMVGRRVEVKARMGAAGGAFEATRIAFEN